MSILITKNGIKNITELLISNLHIDYIYVLFHNEAEASLLSKDIDYFKSLSSATHSGYARIPVTTKHIETDGQLLIGGLVTASDFEPFKLTNRSKITSMTLAASTQEDPNKDLLIMSSLFTEAIPILKDASLTVTTKIKLGN